MSVSETARALAPGAGTTMAHALRALTPEEWSRVALALRGLPPPLDQEMVSDIICASSGCGEKEEMVSDTISLPATARAIELARGRAHPLTDARDELNHEMVSDTISEVDERDEMVSDTISEVDERDEMVSDTISEGAT